MHINFNEIKQVSTCLFLLVSYQFVVNAKRITTVNTHLLFICL